MASSNRSRGLQELLSKQPASICPSLLVKPSYWVSHASQEPLSFSRLHIVLAFSIYENFDIVAPSLPPNQQNKYAALAISEHDVRLLAKNYDRLTSEPWAVDETDFYVCVAFLQQQQGLDWRNFLNVAFERNFVEWDDANIKGDGVMYSDSARVCGAPVITVCIPSYELHRLAKCSEDNSKTTSVQQGKADLPG